MPDLSHPPTDPFPPTNVVFHDRSIFDAEQARLFGDGWLFERLDEGPLGEDEERVGGLVFRRRGSGGSLREFLGPLLPAVEAVAEGTRSLLFETRMEIAGNWKLVVSGAIEDYHLPTVHAQTVTPWRTDAAKPLLGPGGHSSYATRANVGSIPRTLHRLLVSSAPVDEVFENTLIFPNLLLIRLWGLVHVTTFEPLSPGRTQRVTRVFVHAPKRSGLDPRAWTRALVGRVFQLGAGRTFSEDQRVVEEAQAGTLAGRHRRRGPAHAEEARVEHFLAEVGRRLRL